jgi:hypothetical protein
MGLGPPWRPKILAFPQVPTGNQISYHSVIDAWSDHSHSVEDWPQRQFAR